MGIFLKIDKNSIKFSSQLLKLNSEKYFRNFFPEFDFMTHNDESFLTFFLQLIGLKLPWDILVQREQRQH